MRQQGRHAVTVISCTIKAYLAAFASENVHTFYDAWRDIVTAIDKLLHRYSHGEKMVGDLRVLQSQGIRSASSASRCHRPRTKPLLTGGCQVVESRSTLTRCFGKSFYTANARGKGVGGKRVS